MPIIETHNHIREKSMRRESYKKLWREVVKIHYIIKCKCGERKEAGRKEYRNGTFIEERNSNYKN